MFFEEGWVPLSEVTSEVFRRLQGLHAAGEMGEMKQGLSKILAISVWDICDASTKIGVTSADSTIVPASKDLVSWADPGNLSNEHINLRFGSIGSTTLPGENGELPGQDELRARYGGFLNMPVVIPINNFQSSLTFLKEEVAGQPDRDETVLRAAQVIVKMVDSGELVTREIARVKLGSALSRRKLKMAWSLAAQHRPDLAAPNRWIGL